MPQRENCITIAQVARINNQQLQRLGRLAMNMCREGNMNLTDSPLSFMDNIMWAVKDIVEEGTALNQFD